MKVSKGELTARYIIYIILGVLTFLTLYPFWHVIMYSLSDSHAAMSGGLFFYPRNLSLAAYDLLFQSKVIFQAYGNTIYRTIIGTMLNIVMTVLIAYPLSRKRFRGRNLLSLAIFFTMLFGGGMIPGYLVVYNLGLLDSRLSLIIPGAMSAFNMFIVKTYFQNIPDSLEESASIDGATPPRTLLSIILPVSTPVLATIALFYGIGHWNAFIDCVLYINDASKQVLQVYLRGLLNSSALSQLSDIQQFEKIGSMTEETMKMASVVMSVLPVLFVYPWLQKYYVKGMMIGSIKG